MKIMDRLSRLLGRSIEAKTEPESGLLNPTEIRQIVDGNPGTLSDFAASRRLHATDLKGDTPLHLAARRGNLALCDLFIRSGADPAALNHERQTPADVALAEGHRLAAQLLFSLISNLQDLRGVKAREECPSHETSSSIISSHSASPLTEAEETKPAGAHQHLQKTDAGPSWTDERVELLKQMWSEGQSANQIARELGGVTRNAVLSKVHRLGLWEKESGETGRYGDITSEVPAATAMLHLVDPVQSSNPEVAPIAVSPNGLDDLGDSLSFEAEEEPETFFAQSASGAVSGTFVTLDSSASAVSDDKDGDWELDLSLAQIAGEGIGAGVAAVTNHGTEHDFLKVHSRGRQSIKRAVVQTSTQLSIDPRICITWAEETLGKGCCSTRDIEDLIASCEGNGDLEELCINLQRNLEAAGFDLIDSTAEHDDVRLWGVRSDISSDCLAEAIQAMLTRATRLPGTQQFVMSKPDEVQLLESMVRAKQELQLEILACAAAVDKILKVLGSIRDGFQDPRSVSLRTIIPSRPSHSETSEVMVAAKVLESWQAGGRVMDGKRRREALVALEALDLSLAFQKELVRSLEQDATCREHAIRLEGLISIYEVATEHLIREHLPYARRFAARNVEGGEDPEDVFQVAFMGLQRSTRRFDPERGFRFRIYATYWMRQAIMRWRADEGAGIRVPVHRNKNLAELDRALERLDVRADGAVPDDALATELEWAADEVRQFRRIPRKAEYLESIDEWEDLVSDREEESVFDQAETERIVTDALAELQDRQADVIRMRFGIGQDAEMTLEEIGQLYGVTRERIRQIEAKALDHLSHPGRKRRLQVLLGR